MSNVEQFHDHVNGQLGFPAGFAANSYGKVLKKLMSDDDAIIAMELTLELVSAADYALRLGKPLEEVKPVLDKLANNGIIFCQSERGELKYRLVSYMPGMMEFMMNKKTLDKEMAELFQQYTYDMGASGMIANFPKGSTMMRIIPVTRAIEAEQRRASYEEIIKYVNAGDQYSLAPCMCRSSKRLTGEGCGHTTEDICIQIGPYADYYVRTGRGRRASKEEVLSVIKKAEEEGLVHQIFTSEGIDFSSFICNCCGCGCDYLEIVNKMKIPYGTTASNYKAQVDKEKCVACGACVAKCPFQALRLGDSVCGRQIAEPPIIETPYDSEWTQDKWDLDYRVRHMVAETGTSPCITECPAHISVQGYIRMAAEGRYTEALELIKRENPLPAICGRICPHNCEQACSRNVVDEPIAIDDIKRFIADKDLFSDSRYIPEIKTRRDERVAVIGAGPAGLSCAYYLALEGYLVTVFEKQPLLGGMLTHGIPSFRLGKDVINAEIDIISQMGVMFETGVEVGKDKTIQQLRDKGYKAFYMAIGAQNGRKLNIEGEDLDGVVSGVEFLRNISFGRLPALSGPVVVVGGGNVAIDVARSAVRCGASSVDLYCLESREEMPAMDEEVEEAVQEGIMIHHGWGPKKILGADGTVTAIEFRKCLSVYDDERRYLPVFENENTIKIPAAAVLVSIGQDIEWGGLLEASGCELTPKNTIKVNALTYQTDEQDIFAGGDAVTGPKFAIDAIAAGKQGALSIHRFIQGDNLRIGRERNFKAINLNDLNTSGYDNAPRQRPNSHNRNEITTKGFLDCREGLTEEQVRRETQRCLGCGATVVNEETCMGCGVCTLQCKFDAIKLVRVSDEIPAKDRQEIRQNMAKFAGERYGRIMAKTKGTTAD